MSKKYKRNCNYCNNFYIGQSINFCSKQCSWLNRKKLGLKKNYPKRKGLHEDKFEIIKKYCELNYSNKKISILCNISESYLKIFRKKYSIVLYNKKIKNFCNIYYCIDCKKVIRTKSKRCKQCQKINFSKLIKERKTGFCNENTQKKIKEIFLLRTGINNPGKYVKKHFISKKQTEIFQELQPYNFETEKYIGKYRVDFINYSKKIVIEIYGDYWHANPKIYNENFYNKNKQMIAKEIWKYDEERKNYIIANGYKFFSFFESEIKMNLIINTIRSSFGV
jgi:very-short-patch-repair endonuclease